MKTIPEELQYTKEHEWVRVEGDIAYVGITHYAQDALGELVYAETELPSGSIQKSSTVSVVESVKSASDIYSPLSGEIIEFNPKLQSNPALINSDPYGEGWIFRVKFSDPSELESLLTAENYQKQLSVETR